MAFHRIPGVDPPKVVQHEVRIESHPATIAQQHPEQVVVVTDEVGRLGVASLRNVCVVRSTSTACGALVAGLTYIRALRGGSSGPARYSEIQALNSCRQFTSHKSLRAVLSFAPVLLVAHNSAFNVMSDQLSTGLGPSAEGADSSW